mgnify:CR=1 FL=1
MGGLRTARCIVSLVLAVLLVSSNLPRAEADEPCGLWEGSVADQRLGLTQIVMASGSDCYGAFVLRNETGVPILGGGYTLESRTSRAENALVAWLTLRDMTGDVLLVPSLPVEIHVLPLDISSRASITVEGMMTVKGLATDTAAFFLKTLLAFVPSKSCLVPEEQLAYAATRVSFIFVAAAERVLKADFIGARLELQQVTGAFLEHSASVFQEIGIDCAVNLSKEPIRRPIIITKLIFEYLAWIPVVFWHYFQYAGKPVYASLVYEPPYITPATATAIPTVALSPTPPDTLCYPNDLSGYVYRTGTTTGVPGAVVRLIDNRTGEVITSTKTEADGYWNVCCISCGPYCARTALDAWVQEVDPPDWTSHSAYVYCGDDPDQFCMPNIDDPNNVSIVGMDCFVPKEIIFYDDPKSTSTETSWPEAEKVAFVGADGNIWVMESDGSNKVRITSGDKIICSPSWSPDGNWIAYVVLGRGGRLGNFGGDVWIASTDGSKKVRLTGGVSSFCPISWLPDSSRIVFTYAPEGHEPGMYTVDTRRKGAPELYLPLEVKEREKIMRGAPVWSRDGRKVVYYDYENVVAAQGDCHSIRGLSVASLDGTSPRRLVSWSPYCFFPASVLVDHYAAWSPDGTEIAFVSDRTGNGDIYVMDASTGTILRQLTDDETADLDPAWSPDGTKIAFTAYRDGPAGLGTEVYIMNATDGSGQTNLTNNSALDSDPAWSPDGNWIAFVSTRGDGSQIYIMNVDDPTDVREFTAEPMGGALTPDWGVAPAVVELPAIVEELGIPGKHPDTLFHPSPSRLPPFYKESPKTQTHSSEKKGLHVPPVQYLDPPASGSDKYDHSDSDEHHALQNRLYVYPGPQDPSRSPFSCAQLLTTDWFGP